MTERQFVEYIKRVAAFEDAVREDEMQGSFPPEERGKIEATYKNAKAELLAFAMTLRNKKRKQNV